MVNTTNLSSNEIGRHAELLAATALLANGYSVMEPLSPQPYDYAIRHPENNDTKYVQVKSVYSRNEERYGGEYLIVRGAKRNGETYRKEKVDLFAAVWDGKVYLFPNREKSEYWIRPEQIDEKWTEIGSAI